MLTLQQLKEMEPHTIFATGVGMDGRDEIRWVANRSEIHDWAIFYGRLDQTEDNIRDYGDKLFSEDKIKAFVHCDDEAFKMYNY